MRLGIIGSGAIVHRFARAVAESPHASIHATYSRSASRARELADAFGAEHAFDSLDAFLSCDDIDTVYIASPNICHAPQALEALTHGKHVLVEKPFAANEREAEEVFAAARERGLIAMEAMRNLHGPGFATLIDEVGRLGEPISASLRFAKVSPRAAKLDEGQLTNVFDPAMAGGALMDIGIYPVALMCALWGRPEHVSANGLVRDLGDLVGESPDRRIDLGGDALCSYGDFACHLSWGKVFNDYAPSQIACSEGTLLMDATEQPTWLKVMTPVDEHADYGTGAGDERMVELEQRGYNMVWEIEVMAAAVAGNSQGLLHAEAAQETTCAALSVTDEIRRRLGVTFPRDSRLEAPANPNR